MKKSTGLASVALAMTAIVMTAAPTLLAQTPQATQPQPVHIQWAAQDSAGQTVTVPLSDRASVILFVMPDQPQSREAINRAKATLVKGPPVQAVVVLAPGQGAEQRAAELKALSGWPVLIDKDYVISGKSFVRVWPTTLVVLAGGPDGPGEQAAHLAGLARSYAEQLASYVAFAAGRIDRAALDRQLATHQIIGDTPSQMAERHFLVAQRLMAKGLVEQARGELESALKLQPRRATVQLALARVLITLKRADQAVGVLAGIDDSAAPPWQIDLLRGRAMLALGQWDQARAILTQAARLNPEPAEAYYALGLVYQHQGDWQQAAEAFRSAFQATAEGRDLADDDARHPPTSQPGSP